MHNSLCRPVLENTPLGVWCVSHLSPLVRSYEYFRLCLSFINFKESLGLLVRSGRRYRHFGWTKTALIQADWGEWLNKDCRDRGNEFVWGLEQRLYWYQTPVWVGDNTNTVLYRLLVWETKQILCSYRRLVWVSLMTEPFYLGSIFRGAFEQSLSWYGQPS